VKGKGLGSPVVDRGWCFSIEGPRGGGGNIVGTSGCTEEEVVLSREKSVDGVRDAGKGGGGVGSAGERGGRGETFLGLRGQYRENQPLEAK